MIPRGSTAATAVMGLLLCACVEKDPEIPVKGRRPLSHTEKLRVKKNILKTPPAKLRFRVNASLEGKIIYLGLHTPAKVVVPGKPFTLIHYWQVKKPVPGWKMFVHSNGPKLSDFRNWDHIPVFGLHPVTQWQPGGIIRDQHSITLPKNTKYREVDIYVGIWRGAARLKVKRGKQDGKNRVLAARIPVGRQGAAKARPTGPQKRYVVRRARSKITLDGQATEADWKSAPWTDPFVHSLKGTAMDQTTRARVLYDDKNLYVYLEAEDDDVWCKVDKPDDLKMWTEQVFELFIDADGDGGTYVGLQVNPRGILFDAYLPRPGQAQTDWQSGMKARVKVNGTLNKPGDKDQGWQAELAIPLKSVAGRSGKAIPLPIKPGTTWRVNFYRTDRPAKGALKAWAWSPPLRPTFHALDRFGVLVFGDAQGKTSPAQKKTPPAAMKPAAMKPAARRRPMARGMSPRPR